MLKLVKSHGPKNWSFIAKHLPGRIGKQCRERWHNHLNPEIVKEKWTDEEDRTIIEAHKEYSWVYIDSETSGQWLLSFFQEGPTTPSRITGIQRFNVRLGCKAISSLSLVDNTKKLLKNYHFRPLKRSKLVRLKIPHFSIPTIRWWKETTSFLLCHSLTRKRCYLIQEK